MVHVADMLVNHLQVRWKDGILCVEVTIEVRKR
jgi:hypothetical protein